MEGGKTDKGASKGASSSMEGGKTDQRASESNKDQTAGHEAGADSDDDFELFAGSKP